MTGIAVAVYENLACEANDVVAARSARQRELIGHQLKGIEEIEGTYPFTLERSVQAYRINRYLHQLIDPAFRERFRGDPESTYEEAGLTDEERDLITRRDWRGMIHYGVIFFLLEKLGAVSGVSNLHIYAAMRGQSLEDFQKTRNAPGALYSVAGGAGNGAQWSGSKS
ncbi:MAG: gallate dioxygenase, partial [Cupriavidus sp.]|nr:gallate dioxygenase [Cupriavidus sp.]